MTSGLFRHQSSTFGPSPFYSVHDATEATHSACFKQSLPHSALCQRELTFFSRYPMLRLELNVQCTVQGANLDLRFCLHKQQHCEQLQAAHSLHRVRKETISCSGGHVRETICYMAGVGTKEINWILSLDGWLLGFPNQTRDQVSLRFQDKADLAQATP